jgi:hypothetical protein
VLVGAGVRDWPGDGLVGGAVVAVREGLGDRDGVGAGDGLAGEAEVAGAGPGLAAGPDGAVPAGAGTGRTRT